PFRDLRREDLADGGFCEEGFARVAQSRRVVDGQPGGFDVDNGASDLMLNGLELADRLAELLPLLHVADRGIERPAGEAEHLRADPDPSFVQGFDGDLVTFSGLTE